VLSAKDLQGTSPNPLKRQLGDFRKRPENAIRNRKADFLA
jgi:hypothetical protein